jgi:hypothetical protein
MKNIDRLEEFVKSHSDEFSFFEPSAAVWERINRKNKEKKTFQLRHYFLRIAALVALVAISTIMILTHSKFNRLENAKAADPQIEELLETEQFYAQQVTGKLEEIRKCYLTFPDLKENVESDLNELESMYNSLKNDLKDNISNKPVIEAMIENNRVRLKLVDSVLEQIKC